MNVFRATPFFWLASFLFFANTVSGVAEDVVTLQARFDKEADGVRKAKLLEKLGDAQFAQERAASKANDFSGAALILEKYRDNARAALDGLRKVHPDAERKPAGYKHLELHIQTAIREVDDLLSVAPEPYRPPLQLVRKDLLALDDELLRSLFPRRPGEKPIPPASGTKP